MNIDNDIKVSVCVVTYNQEKYIAECLESLVTQQTNFKFEIIVGEDCSTDNTRKIVQSYVDRYPDLFVPLFYKKNLGPVGNLKEVYKKAQGQYIAHMDGDDLALPNKLQKQFDTLASNPDCVICAHNMGLIDNENKILKIKNNFMKETNKIDWKEYLNNPPIFAHSSKFFLKETLTASLFDLNEETLDFELHLESLRFGKIYYLSEVLGNYRQMAGVSSNAEMHKIYNRGFIRMYSRSFIFFKDHDYIKRIYKFKILFRILASSKRLDFKEMFFLLKNFFKLN